MGAVDGEGNEKKASEDEKKENQKKK